MLLGRAPLDPPLQPGEPAAVDPYGRMSHLLPDVLGVSPDTVSPGDSVSLLLQYRRCPSSLRFDSYAGGSPMRVTAPPSHIWVAS